MIVRTSRPAGPTVVDRLRVDILSGELAQGQRLTEDQLSERYGVSRIPIREALTLLHGEGYVERAPFKHTFVAVLSPEEAGGLFEARAALEEAAIRCAARNKEADWTGIQQVLTEGLVRARQEDRGPAWHLDLNRLDHTLHERIVDASASSIIIGLHRQIRDKIRWVYASGTNHRSAESWQEHQQIVASLISGQAGRAAHLMRKHILRAADYHHYRNEVAGDEEETSADGDTDFS
jgi:DNA-binding GntR family transcriptional regulator